jgi:hypothetical protein
MKMPLIAALFSLAVWSPTWAADPPAATGGFDGPTSTGAAAGYCLAKHPTSTLNSNRVNGYTRDGYEIAGPPGIVGAVKRSFIFDRTTDTVDEGEQNTCAMACAELGKLYGGGVVGRSLKRKVNDGKTILTSGVGDLGSLVAKDFESYTKTFTPQAAWGWSSSYIEQDVAQSDYCCCQVTTTQARDSQKFIAPRGQ